MNQVSSLEASDVNVGRGCLLIGIKTAFLTLVPQAVSPSGIMYFEIRRCAVLWYVPTPTALSGKHNLLSDSFIKIEKYLISINALQSGSSKRSGELPFPESNFPIQPPNPTDLKFHDGIIIEFDSTVR